MSDSTRTRSLRRYGWAILIGVLAVVGILLAVADISAGNRWPNPMSQALVGPATGATPAPNQTQAFRFDRSRVGDRLIFDFPVGGLGPLSPYQALRAFLTNGAGLVLLALAALVIFPSRARNAVERLEATPRSLNRLV